MPSERTSCKLWLQLQCQMVAGASRGAVVKIEAGHEPFTIASWPTDQPLEPDLTAAVNEVLASRRPWQQKQDNALLIARPIEIKRAFWGVVILRLSLRDEVAVAAATHLLQWGEAWLQYALYKPEAAFSDQAITLVNTATQEASWAESAISLVNKVATLFTAERVCLGRVQGKKVQIEAASHAASFDRRAPMMQRIAAAMEEAVLAERSVSLLPAATAESSSKWPKHWHLLQTDGAGAVHTLLLTSGERTVAVMQVQMSPDEDLSAAVLCTLTPVLPILAQAFDLKAEAETSALRQMLVKGQRRISRSLDPGRLLPTATVLALILLLAGLFVPRHFRVAGEALLESTQKHLVVASQDGYLAKVEVRPGDAVKRNDVLAALNDDDLRLQRQKLRSELQQHRHSYNNALAQSQRAQAAVIEAQLDQSAIQLELIERQLERSQLRSPMDGLVISEDISQSVGAPVKQGERLFEIASQKDYRVMLYIDERYISYLHQHQTGQIVLTSLPGQVFDIRVSRITPISEIHDGKNRFRVEAELVNPLDSLRPGMTGNGKISIGQRRYGWILLHGVVDWLRLRLW